tara:strand:- start:1516 stop:2508 length:993 start_codon:yes stop_codon:yes gene_type:complete
MPEIRIFTESDLRQMVPLDLAAIDCVAAAFNALATRDIVMPPIMSFQVPEHNGEVDVKTAYVPGIPSFAVKMSPGFFDNPKIGLPSVNGLMVVFSATTGLVEALLLDNGYLTDIRTAAAGAVAARWLARENAKNAGIVGCGVQARLQLQALTLVRPIREAIIWGRDPEKARACATQCSDELGIPVAVAASVSDVMAADVVVTTTPSTSPLIESGDIKPGQHITAMGSDADYKNELAPRVIADANLYVCDSHAQCLRQGELRAAVAAGAVAAGHPHQELGAVVAGKAAGRQSAADITVCDLTGTGIQDTAIAAFTLQRANTFTLGHLFNSD